ncbi:hypothetical protein CEXT_512461 [Caerostris extrusa]|uniref:Uncharacterized protein n=1 Tax=Caerostris extrusa TaxID=172846 RepID=A0AAV4TJ47_CAEEX|nr:hypothetical protein CEXT_512461 [Caerostris extrusa]
MAFRDSQVVTLPILTAPGQCFTAKLEKEHHRLPSNERYIDSAMCTHTYVILLIKRQPMRTKILSVDERADQADDVFDQSHKANDRLKGKNKG